MNVPVPPGRALAPQDEGRVFVRVDPDGTRGEHLYLRSLGAGPNPVASFITFRVRDGAAHDVGETGYFNGPWYQEARGLAAHLLADVTRRHRQRVEERLASLEEAARADARRDEELRKRFGRPDAWTAVGEGPTGGPASWVVWHDPAGSAYVIDVYGPADELLASRSVACTHDPRFGMDATDHHTIFGERGALAQLLAGLDP